MTRNLQMSLKTKWFEMTKSGEKTEDYREITPYWIKRLIWLHEPMEKEIFEDFCHDLSNPKNDEIKDILNYYLCEFAYFKTNIMTLGYPSKDDKERIIQFEHDGIEIREGREEWGADKGKIYFVIKHGKKL